MLRVMACRSRRFSAIAGRRRSSTRCFRRSSSLHSPTTPHVQRPRGSAQQCADSRGMATPGRLFLVRLGHRKRQRPVDGVEHLEAAHDQLHLARGLFVVHVLPPSQRARDAHHPLLPHALRRRHGGRGRGVVRDDLDDARVVSDVEEEEAAQVSVLVHPAAERHVAADAALAQRAAAVRPASRCGRDSWVRRCRRLAHTPPVVRLRRSAPDVGNAVLVQRYPRDGALGTHEAGASSMCTRAAHAAQA